MEAEAKEEVAMSRVRLRRVAAVAAATGVMDTVVYALFIRPWLLHWGATADEIDEALAGDELVRDPRSESTRAVTIEAPPADVWPWLVQMGQGRGGLYSYDWLENLVGCEIHSEYRVVPELQRLEVGDRIRLVPPSRADLALVVAIVEPERALVLRTPESVTEPVAPGLPNATWAFVVRPLAGGRTRLVVRWRSEFAPGLRGQLTCRAGLEPIQFVMERKMLLGIKQRAEQHARIRTLPLRRSA